VWRDSFRPDGVPRRPALPAILFESGVDPRLGRDRRKDLPTGHEEQLVQDAKVARVAQGDLQIVLPALERNGRVPDGELGGKRGDDVGRDLSEDAPRNIGPSVLLGERFSEVVLSDRATFEQQRAQPSAGESLHAECACHVVFCRRPEGDEDLPDSRHELWQPLIARKTP
jgi:hypothetical protein